MKIRLLSDLHRERGSFTYVDQGEDVIVLAGDIDNGLKGIEWAKTLPKPVVYVSGNHDYWGCDLFDNVENMRTSAAGSNVHFLECDEVIITVNGESIRFLGATLWTDYCEAYLIKHGQSYDAKMQESFMYLAHKSMNDFRQITYKQEPLMPNILLEIHHKSRAWLKDKIDERFHGQTVVVTHHAPSYQSLIHAHDVKDYELEQIIKGRRRPDYEHERIASYASDLEDLAEKVDVWLHGHIHEQMMYNIGKCLVVTNPRGYIRGPQKCNFWWHMSPAQEDKSLAEFKKNPEKGDVNRFDKTFIIDTESTIPAFMLARAKDKVVEINAVIKDMATYVKYTKNDDANITAMAINKTNATTIKYNNLAEEVMKLICYADDVRISGDANHLASRLKLPGMEEDQRMLAAGTLDWLDMTEYMPESQRHFKDAAIQAKRALAIMRKAIKVIKLKLKPSTSNNDCVELREEPIPEMTLITTLSRTGDTLTAELNGENLTANTTEELIKLLLSLGITASDLRFTFGDNALTVGQTVEIRSALRDQSKTCGIEPKLNEKDE